MSVLACHRFKCGNVMCDYMANGHYICDRCLKELTRWKDRSWQDSPPGKVEAKIEEFFRTVPGTFIVEEFDNLEEMLEARDEKFNSLIQRF